MRLPREWYHLLRSTEQYFPDLRSSQIRGLALWVYGAIMAKSACQSAVIDALSSIATFHALRQYLREFLRDGSEKATPCNIQLDVTLCFAPLLRWLLSLWKGQQLALAVDATAHQDRVVALVVSVLYRGSAIPIAWTILPANRSGAWIPEILRLLQLLAPEVSKSMEVLVMTDRGLWSPRLWKQIRALGWHPLMRVKNNTSFQPLQVQRRQARTLIPGPGHAWVGRGSAFYNPKRHRFGTLVVVWDKGQKEPWIVITDLPPEDVGVCWYGLRFWIELGFRALKSVGWQWQRTRRTDPDRVARYWLVLAVATLWATAYGTRAEDAISLGVPPQRVRSPHPLPSCSGPRKDSVIKKGICCMTRQLLQGRPWLRLWLIPEPWPNPLPGLQITYHKPVPKAHNFKCLPQ